MPALLLAALAIIGTAVGLLIYHDDTGVIFGMDSEQFASIAYMSALAVVFGSAALLSRRTRLTEKLRALLVWAALGAALVAAYAYKDGLGDVGQRMLSVLVPGTPEVIDGRTVEVTRDASGHFDIDGAINGRDVRFLVDTGASVVVLSNDTARMLGFHTQSLIYSTPISTANGRTEAAPVTLSNLSIGPVSLNRVTAMIARPGDLRVNLLGMSFLGRLSRFTFEGDRLRLEQ